MSSPKKKSPGSRITAVRIALDGLKQVFVSEPNARIHALITLAVIIAGWLFQISRLEWLSLALTVGLVWVAEIFNTAVEKLVDLASPEIHPAAKAVKDISAGAVLASAVTAVVVGILIFGPRLWLLINW
ncbi:MAG: diacylglycerol kinase family protein [Anaerolineales bacterium]